MSGFFSNQRNRNRSISRDPVGIGMHAQPPRLLPDGTVVQSGVTLQRARGLTFPVTVGLVSVEVLPIDFDRRFLFIQNNDTLGLLWCSYGSAQALGIGMRFTAGGGGILLDNNVPTCAIYMIGTIANNPNITIIAA